MIRRTVLEWGRIPYGNDTDSIPEDDARCIERIAQKSSLSKRSSGRIVQCDKNGLKAKGVVGVISTPTCQLEILPKIEGDSCGDIRISQGAARKHLIHMLATVEDLGVTNGRFGKLGFQGETLLETLICLFCDEVNEAMRNGLPRHYEAKEDNLPALRGSLNVIRQFSINAAYPQRVACNFDVLSHDIPLNRIIRSAVMKLLRVSQIRGNQMRLRRLGMMYDTVGYASKQDLQEGRVMFDRFTRQWKTPILFARLFLLDQYQDTSTGSTEGWSFLFNMSEVFERYINFRINQALHYSEMFLDLHREKMKCLYDGDNGFRDIYPDIVIKTDNRVTHIIDTKWKIIEEKDGRLVKGIKRDDLYQMMAYCQVYRCSNLILLYPHNTKIESNIKDVYSISEPISDNKLTVAIVDITQHSSRQIEILKDLLKLTHQN